jgi:hypothetical protein
MAEFYAASVAHLLDDEVDAPLHDRGRGTQRHTARHNISITGNFLFALLRGATYVSLQ